MINVLFVCRQNSARSILAEALLNRLGAGRFDACSAGYDPASAISPYVIGLLHRINYNTGLLATKPVEAMISKHVPAFDFIIRLAPGTPAGGHWPRFRNVPFLIDWFLPDPCETYEAKALVAVAYEEMFTLLAERIETLANIPGDELHDARIRGRLERLGETPLRLAS